MENLQGGSMWRVLLIALALTGCQQLPLTPQDIEAKKFESISDKAAIYIVRDAMSADVGAPLQLDQGARITTYAGTYYRWLANPGSQTIAATGPSAASITIQAEAGKLYFVHHMVEGATCSGVTDSALKLTDNQTGRARVMQAVLMQTQ
jgi:hypothetical protein